VQIYEIFSYPPHIPPDFFSEKSTSIAVIPMPAETATTKKEAENLERRK
jgi:hypothetical protein